MYKANNLIVFLLSIMSYLKVQFYTDLHTYTSVFLETSNTVSHLENLECLNFSSVSLKTTAWTA